MNITFNSEKNGIEIRFDSKPDQSVIDMLKQYGFRWSRKQCMWFAKQTDERKKLVSQFDKNMDTDSFSTERNYSEKDNNGYNLWEMTRTESIGDNVDKTLCCKDIAATCRKHLRARFPMCKISVTSSHNSVSVTIVSSPFAKDSAELAAISKYCGQYVESFKYCVDYDPYGDYGISKEQAEAYEDLSERIEDASADIIISNGISHTWQTTSFPQYKKQLIQWVEKCNFPFDVNIARAVKDGCFKTALYRILNECDSLKEQFENAGLVADQKVTMIRMSEFGSMSVSRMKFKGFTIGDYAQYKDSVRFVFRPENKRSDYYKWLYGDVLIYDGWMEVPEELLWETFSSPSGLACRKTRFLSCDKKQYDVIIDHFASIGKMPLINTYRPIFQSKHGGDMNDSGRSNQIRHGEAG